MKTDGETFLRKAASTFVAFVVCFLLIYFERPYAHRAWGSLRLVNVIVNLTPTLLAILFAFVVDKDLVGHGKWRWVFRTAVISCGVCLSGLLWHQQTLADIQTENSIKNAVNDAVGKANSHSDQQFGKVQGNVGQIDSEVRDLHKQVETTTSNIIEVFSQQTAGLSKSISNVSQPEQPDKAALQFTLVDEKNPTNPLLIETLRQDEEGVYPVQINFMNTSDETATDSTDIWIDICTACSFAREPDRFDRPAGLDERTRHMALSSMNPGTAYQTTVIPVKFTGGNSFAIQFRYSCKNCGKRRPPQTATIFAIPNLNLPKMIASPSKLR